jgi:hypothetical protein
MIARLKKKPNRYSDKSRHNSYGIVNWLLKRGYCYEGSDKNKIDQTQYKELINEFILWDNPDTDISKRQIEQREQYVQDRFTKFCHFCINIYYNQNKQS